MLHMCANIHVNITILIQSKYVDFNANNFNFSLTASSIHLNGIEIQFKCLASSSATLGTIYLNFVE